MRNLATDYERFLDSLFDDAVPTLPDVKDIRDKFDYDLMRNCLVYKQSRYKTKIGKQAGTKLKDGSYQFHGSVGGKVYKCNGWELIRLWKTGGGGSNL